VLAIRTFLLAALVLSSASRIGAELPRTPPIAPDPVGAYCILEQVVLEPSDTAPARLQMWGAFAVADSGAAGGYRQPVRGYTYYNCPAGRAEACRIEWADLRWIAGTGKAIGYGLRAKPMGRIRREDEPVAAPDVYPIDGGLVKVESKDPNFTSLVAQLKAALSGKDYLMARTFVASITYIPRP
jgi:hypothetical protein